MNRFLSLLCMPLLAFAAGCTSVAKQNIISTVNTGIGISVAQNPQTQIYEVKAGYIRSQFYSVPTGKTFDEYKKTTAGDPEKVPEVLAGIRMHSGVDNLLVGMDVTESFAIGPLAVTSPAAIAMYVSQAKDAKHAEHAAAAARLPGATPAQIATIGALTDKIGELKKSNNTAEATRILGQLGVTPGPRDDVYKLLQNQVRAAVKDPTKLPALGQAFGINQ